MRLLSNVKESTLNIYSYQRNEHYTRKNQQATEKLALADLTLFASLNKCQDINKKSGYDSKVPPKPVKTPNPFKEIS